MNNNRSKKTIFTIGHSNTSFEEFLALLRDNNIELLVDVRSWPYSKYVTHFNRQNLENSLKGAGIDYLYLGHRIGGKPHDRKYYSHGQVSYPLIREGEPFKEGLSQLMELAVNKKTVIMCSEEDPYKCHRHILITPDLIKEGFSVIHIRSDGSLEKVERQKTLFESF